MFAGGKPPKDGRTRRDLDNRVDSEANQCDASGDDTRTNRDDSFERIPQYRQIRKHAAATIEGVRSADALQILAVGSPLCLPKAAHNRWDSRLSVNVRSYIYFCQLTHF